MRNVYKWLYRERGKEKFNLDILNFDCFELTQTPEILNKRVSRRDLLDSEQTKVKTGEIKIFRELWSKFIP